MPLPLPARLSGATLRALAQAAKTAPARAVFMSIAKGDLGLDALMSLAPEVRALFPLDVKPLRAREVKRAVGRLGPVAASPSLPLASTLVERFRAREQTPTQLLENVLDAVETLGRATPSMSPMVALDEAAMREAEASTRRWAKKKPLGPLDGVPVTIKEQTNIAGLPTRAGTDYLPNTAARQDAVLVSRLRQAGAIVVGHSMMTEFGMSPIGYNAKRAMPKNPHHAGCSAGGSSTGAAVSVATGLVPLALGADGGGSIRTPSACTGIFGLKPTFGRMTRTGDLFSGSMCHLGPLGRSARELALFVDLLGIEDPLDSLTVGAPAPNAIDGLGRGVKGLRIGVPDEEWAEADRVVQSAGRAALEALVKEGAELVPVRARLFRHAPAIGFLTIGIESYAELLDIRTYHYDAMGPDLRFFLSLVRELPADGYLDAQRLRHALRIETAQILREVDVIALPTLVGTAPRITDTELREGFVDPKLLSGLCRYAFLANLTGLPAASCPVGKDGEGLPIGLQIVGDAFDEATVLQVVDHLERLGVAKAERPVTHVEI